jgi:hypothetical protein
MGGRRFGAKPVRSGRQQPDGWGWTSAGAWYTRRSRTVSCAVAMKEWREGDEPVGTDDDA